MARSNLTHAHDDHSHTYDHRHDPASPHPPQSVSWSILRMSVTSRLVAALAVSAGLWAIVLLATR